MKGTLVRFEDMPELSPPQHRNFVTRTLLTKALHPHLSLHASELKVGGEIVLHHHEEVGETFFMTGGRALATLGERVEEVGPGACGYVPPGVRHGVKNIGKEPVTLVVIYTPPLV